jgi:type VI protein secretion system component VasK
MKLPASHPLHLVLGLTLWFVWFCVVYGGLSVACAVAPPLPEAGSLNPVNASLLVLTVLTTVLLAWAARRCWGHAQQFPAGSPPGRKRFVADVSAALYALAAVSTLVVGLPLLLLPPCL